MIYLDNNATTQTAPEAMEAMLPYFSERYGNPSSVHTFGREMEKVIQEARVCVAELLGAENPLEILFTSCGTEGDNTALRGVLAAEPKKRHLVTTAVEHSAILNLCQRLREEGVRVSLVPVDSKGNLDCDVLKKVITSDTALVSCMWANNETGAVFPVGKISEICREKGVLFHCDAVQAVGKIPIDLKKIGIDLLTLSGHKIHAPKGIGALYVRRGTRLKPFLVGGHQENGRRGGTENVPGIVALGIAARLARENIVDENTGVRALRDRLEKGILKACPEADVNGAISHRLPNTTNISFEFLEAGVILQKLSDEGICASSGSACTSGSLEPSHVLRAMRLSLTRTMGSIRFSLSRYNTGEEMDEALRRIPKIIADLRSATPSAMERTVAH